MRIHRLRVENFRGISAAELELDPQGLTVIQAPNESGKSSLFEALDLLLSAKDNSTRADLRAVRPVDGEDRPTRVEAELSFGDLEVVYAKSWFKDRGTTLQLRGREHRDLQGARAHDAMAAIFRDEVDQALYRALRFDQGEGLGAPELGGSESLARALAQPKRSGKDHAPRDLVELDELDAQRDDAGLFERITAAYQRHWTKASPPKPKKAWAEAEAEFEAAQTRLAELEARLAGLDKDAARCDELAKDLERTRRQLAELRPQLLEAETQATRIAAQREQLREIERELEKLALAEASAGRELEARDALIARADKSADAAQALAAKVEAHGEDTAPAGEGADAAHAAALAARAAAEAAVEEAHRETMRLETWARVRRLEARVAQLAELEARVEAIDAELATLPLDAAGLESLREAHDALALARASLRAGAPSLRIEAGPELGEHSLALDGEALRLDPDAPLEAPIGRELSLELPGRISLALTVHGATREAAESVREAEAEFARVAARAGTEDLERARAQVTQREQLVRERQGRLDELALLRRPDEREVEAGDDLARDPALALAHARGRLRELEEEARNEDAPTPTVDGAALERARTEVQRRRDALREADAALHAGTEARLAEARAREAAREALVRERALLEAATERSREDAQALAEAREQSSDERLAEAEAEAKAALEAETQRSYAARRALEAEAPETIEATVQNRRARIERAETNLRDKDKELHGLRAQIRTLGDEGLGERRDAAAAELERRREGIENLRAQAEAARCLYEVMSEARERQRERLRAPLRAQIETLGKVIWGPEFGVELDESLRVQSRTLAGRQLPFESLSAGAREQLSIIAALAAARLTADEGVPVILDDSLGYADPQRLERMGVVLDLAAKEGQIIVLTCLPERFSTVGRARQLRLGSDTGLE